MIASHDILSDNSKFEKRTKTNDLVTQHVHVGPLKFGQEYFLTK